MSNELATREPARGTLAVPSARAMVTAEALVEETQQRDLLGQYVRHHMVEGTDFGVIPGTENRTLLKPGAEKLTQLFRCIPRFTIEEKIENWDSGLFYYRFACRIETLADGNVVAEGVGSCSTYESRYRWRNADRKCPECGAAAIKRSKYPPKDRPAEKPGWYCFGKVGGCGANFAADDQAIAGQAVGRVQNPDLHDQTNTVLKMAKKRALVDAAIALARCSDIFTQDAEDFAADTGPGPAETPRQQQPAKPAPPKVEPVSDAEMRQLGAGLQIATSGDRLKAGWDAVNAVRHRLTPLQLQQLTEVKDRIKAALTARPKPPTPASVPPVLEEVNDALRDLRESGCDDLDGYLLAQFGVESYAAVQTMPEADLRELLKLLRDPLTTAAGVPAGSAA